MVRKFALLLAMIILSAAAFVPTRAQETKTNTVSFNGVSFSFDSSIGTSANIVVYPGSGKNAQQPGGPDPKHTTFMLYTQKPDDAGGGDSPVYENFVVVYKATDWKGYTDFEKRVSEVEKLIAAGSDLNTFTPPKGDTNKELPFLPIYPASQVMRAQAKYIKTDQVSGYSFISAYRQDVFPFISHDLVYLFVGLSADKQTVVSVNIRMDTKLFPKEVPSKFDYDAFVKTLDKYMQESTDTVNKAKATDFTPALTSLETLVKSISVK